MTEKTPLRPRSGPTRRALLGAGASALASLPLVACNKATAAATATPEAAAPTTTPAATSASPRPLAIGKAGKQPLAFPARKFGVGGTQLGSVFFETSDEQAYTMLQSAWDAGVRYFDTSPWYGLGLSERRLGQFLDDKDPDEYLLSTKVGRVLYPDESAGQIGIWANKNHFGYRYDYSAEGVRRSLEDSLQRLGVPKIDIVLIHDLAPSNTDFEDWEAQLQIAIEGAMPELSRLRDDGYIRGWGMGVNDIEPALAALEAADPDVILQATRYSLIEHEDALTKLFPVCREKQVGVIVGAPLNAGFLAGAERWHYGEALPPEHLKKREQLRSVAAEHGVDLRTAALQFTTAPDVVVATIPGARDAEQARADRGSMEARIPPAFWDQLRVEGLIHPEAAIPTL
ncbi:aldo/keto reductase [Pseudenhygromyxa sp. WMMC2535]|uniref:aldo/keto reductase n=1 Tax=Pseudenhygromyxa sp. WMMC2535 TaxID=2712867 RepID=UPI0015540F3D|nr:aldo/keto reductase [Pseudenhygromyxa sp. WMMC2535]NVB41455.1 aldo/keto reductase [Pseudenhygromyxa sp. WMMC2535]